MSYLMVNQSDVDLQSGELTTSRIHLETLGPLPATYDPPFLASGRLRAVINSVRC